VTVVAESDYGVAKSDCGATESDCEVVETDCKYKANICSTQDCEEDLMKIVNVSMHKYHYVLLMWVMWKSLLVPVDII
jgi:hypothetical protein